MCVWKSATLGDLVVGLVPTLVLGELILVWLIGWSYSFNCELYVRKD